MLVALNEHGERITAKHYLDKDEEYYCPECGELLIFRNGIKRIPHFAHRPNESSCIMKIGGESYIHNAMKIGMKDIIERDNNVTFSELEWKITGKNGDYVIPDYYFKKYDNYGITKRCAVECVHKHDDLPHFLEKNKFYFENKIYPIWVFDVNRFKDDDKNIKDVIRISDILKEAHAYYFGKVWAIDYENKTLHAVHFNKYERYVEEKTLIDWDEWDGHSDPTQHEYSVGGYWKNVPTKKQPLIKNIQKFKVTSFQYKKSDNFMPYPRLVAGPFLKPFWK